MNCLPATSANAKPSLAAGGWSTVTNLGVDGLAS